MRAKRTTEPREVLGRPDLMGRSWTSQILQGRGGPEEVWLSRRGPEEVLSGWDEIQGGPWRLRSLGEVFAGEEVLAPSGGSEEVLGGSDLREEVVSGPDLQEGLY